MSIVRKSISFTEQQENWIKLQIEEGHYTNDSEYIRDLVRQDQNRNNKLVYLRKAIKEGIESGVSEKSILEILNQIDLKLNQT